MAHTDDINEMLELEPICPPLEALGEMTVPEQLEFARTLRTFDEGFSFSPSIPGTHSLLFSIQEGPSTMKRCCNLSWFARRSLSNFASFSCFIACCPRFPYIFNFVYASHLFSIQYRTQEPCFVVADFYRCVWNSEVLSIKKKTRFWLGTLCTQLSKVTCLGKL